MKRFTGIKASAGIAMGPVQQIQVKKNSQGRVVRDPARERVLFDAAVVLAKEELGGLQAKATGDDRNIFVFQQALLDDTTLVDEVYKYIDGGAGAAAAMERAAALFASTLEQVQDDYIRLRSTDVQDACRRVVDILDGRPRGKLRLDQPSILVAEQIMPSDILALGRGMILGIATSSGSVQSHAAIISRSMGIPAVVGLGREFLAASAGHQMLLDADAGVALVDPDQATCAQARMHMMELQEERDRLSGLRDMPNCTRDGTRFTLTANCSGPEDIQMSVESGAEGVGLLRSEFLVIDANTFPTEQEQYYFYTSCLAAADGRPVTVRTFDLGADKLAASMTDREINPALGMRGLRFCLHRREDFLVQLCALLRAGTRGPLKVMFPMISGLEDWKDAMACVEEAKERLRSRGQEFREDLVFGCMVEIPGAALMAKELAKAGCGFFSVGTNDLVQYTLAADRMDDRMNKYYRTESDAVFRLIDMVVEAGREYDIPVSVCGLAASDPMLARRLVLHGVRGLSMASQSLVPVKQELLNLDLDQDVDRS